MLQNTEFIIIPGVRKSGTSTLFEILKLHPQIATCPLKEPSFFAFNDFSILEKKYYQYLKLFKPDNTKYLLDASTTYFINPESIQNIKKLTDNVKIIIMFREPVKMAYSSYLHNQRLSPPIEKRKFEDIIDNIKNGSYKNIIESENINIKYALKKKLIKHSYISPQYFKINKYLNTSLSITDPFWVFKYFKQAMYNYFYEQVLSAFQKENIKIIFFEKFIKSPQESIDEILNFLGLEKIEYKDIYKQYNKTRLPRNKFAELISFMRVKFLAFNLLYEKLGKNQFLRKFFYNQLFYTPKISKNLYYKARKKIEFIYNYWFEEYSFLKGIWTY